MRIAASAALYRVSGYQLSGAELSRETARPKRGQGENVRSCPKPAGAVREDQSGATVPGECIRYQVRNWGALLKLSSASAGAAIYNIVMLLIV